MRHATMPRARARHAAAMSVPRVYDMLLCCGAMRHERYAGARLRHAVATTCYFFFADDIYAMKRNE